MAAPAAFCFLLAGGCSQALAPEAEIRLAAAEVTAHPDPLSLLADEDPARAANKRLVFDMWRSVVNAGRVELADEMLREDYIQHSPVLPTGREAFKQIFSAIERREIPETVSPPLVALLAEGELVVMALREELPEPDGEGNYTTTHFNLFRVEAGRLAEHWHSVQAEPGPDVPPPDRGGPQPVTGVAGAAQDELLAAERPDLEANKRLVFDAMREVIFAGREESAATYFSENYVEHDPNGGSGLAALERRIVGQSDSAIPDAIPHSLVAMVADGDLVTVITGHEHPHPAHPGESYTTTQFDMYRIEDGLIVEHWNGDAKPGGERDPYG